jgi:hypothetical protein
MSSMTNYIGYGELWQQGGREEHQIDETSKQKSNRMLRVMQRYEVGGKINFFQ